MDVLDMTVEKIQDICNKQTKGAIVPSWGFSDTSSYQFAQIALTFANKTNVYGIFNQNNFIFRGRKSVLHQEFDVFGEQMHFSHCEFLRSDLKQGSDLRELRNWRNENLSLTIETNFVNFVTLTNCVYLFTSIVHQGFVTAPKNVRGFHGN
jgi:hypothetical protein